MFVIPKPRVAGPRTNIRGTLLRWRAVARHRRELKSLDDRLLEDVGISRKAVRIELAKPFWR